MFRIPNFYKMEMTLEEATSVLEIDNDLLKGMEHVNNMWERHCNEEDVSDSDFYDSWIYEVNAFNVVFEKMKSLFDEDTK